MLRTRMGAVSEGFRDDPLIPSTFVPVDDLQGAVWDTLQLGLGARTLIPAPSYRLRFPPESNELFRLGGTTYNPLRGYDDFEIVPRESINRRFLVTETTDSTGAKTYDVLPSSVFYPGGKYMFVFTAEWQFTIADPLHGLLFFDLGGTWNDVSDFSWNTLHRGMGLGFRMEVPLLGLIGFDYGYGFDRLDRATGSYDRRGWEPHIQFGRMF
jgi:outer membrane protein assembly factor BamA